MKKHIVTAFLGAWVMWFNVDGQWRSGLSFETKVACEDEFQKAAIAVAQTLQTDGTALWQVEYSGFRSLTARDARSGKTVRINLVCYPSDFNPR